MGVAIIIALVIAFTVGLIPLIVLSERRLQAQRKSEPQGSREEESPAPEEATAPTAPARPPTRTRA